MKKIVIVGAGAMGCLFAARLAEVGADVTLVDVDTARLGIIGRDGITVEDDNGRHTTRVAVAAADAIREHPDLVMLFTKAVHSKAAVESVSHLAGPMTYALTLQNGLGNADELVRVFSRARTLMGITGIPSNLKGPAHIESRGRGSVRLGAAGQPTVAAAAAAAAVAALFDAADIETVVEQDIDVAIWEKAAFNAALNSVGAVTGLTNGGLNEPSGRRLVFGIVEEAVAVATSMGIAVSRDRIVNQVEFALRHHAEHRASMLEDLRSGRMTEIESINGAIVGAGERAGVACPVTATMADLVRMLERKS